MNDAKYIGLDVHQATISVAVRDSAGKLVMEAVLETKAEAILQFLRGLRGSLHVTLEEGTWATMRLPGPSATSAITSELPTIRPQCFANAFRDAPSVRKEYNRQRQPKLGLRLCQSVA